MLFVFEDLHNPRRHTIGKTFDLHGTPSIRFSQNFFLFLSYRKASPITNSAAFGLS